MSRALLDTSGYSAFMRGDTCPQNSYEDFAFVGSAGEGLVRYSTRYTFSLSCSLSALSALPKGV